MNETQTPREEETLRLEIERLVEEREEWVREREHLVSTGFTIAKSRDEVSKEKEQLVIEKEQHEQTITGLKKDLQDSIDRVLELERQIDDQKVLKEAGDENSELMLRVIKKARSERDDLVIRECDLASELKLAKEELKKVTSNICVDGVEHKTTKLKLDSMQNDLAQWKQTSGCHLFCPRVRDVVFNPCKCMLYCQICVQLPHFPGAGGLNMKICSNCKTPVESMDVVKCPDRSRHQGAALL